MSPFMLYILLKTWLSSTSVSIEATLKNFQNNKLSFKLVFWFLPLGINPRFLLK